jgi:putative sigma-54 modulation protein
MQTANANPHVKVTGRHLAITPAINDYATRKIEGLHLDYPKIIEAHVLVGVEKKYRHWAEIVLVCSNHITIEAREENRRPLRRDRCRDGQDRAPDAQVQDASSQASIVRARRGAPSRGSRFLHPEPIEEEEHHEHAVVRTERYPVKPMFVDEAVLQLEMSTRQFLVFMNARNLRVNVLYRRKSGDFGLIEPSLG